MGKTIVHCGDSGTGLAVKICNNLILGELVVCEFHRDLLRLSSLYSIRYVTFHFQFTL